MQGKIFLSFILLQLCIALAFGEVSKTDRNAKRKANIQASKYSQKFNSFLEPDAKFDEFKPKRALGQGSFGVVQLVEHKRDGKLYAMKTIELEKNGFAEFQTEVNALRSSTSQFIVPLIYSFWDEHWLYGHLVFNLCLVAIFLIF
uniref:non-specific serine/threonine protein kinase n=1 Tax=Ditylenchus dipsaci TaxID=166011 RepID=A0A915DXL7_9BILA